MAMELTRYESAMLNGKEGRGAQLAMEIIVRLAELYGADELIPITQAHIDGCLYAAVGEAGLEFAEKLAELGARVRVPTTLNATSRDIEGWRDHQVAPDFAEKSRRMEQAYLDMGALPTWTCAPYQAGLVPRFGEQVAWAESNAIAYVNSVIGARTERYGDYTDICCAITGRAPYFGLHRPENRTPEVLIDCSDLALQRTPSDFAALGYLVGKLVEDRIPLLTGVPRWISGDQLKAFSAAAASSGAVALFHIAGITPEAQGISQRHQDKAAEETLQLTEEQLLETRHTLSTVERAPELPGEVDVVVVGCPHASAAELMELAELLDDRKVQPGVQLWIYTNDTAYAWLERRGALSALEDSGAVVFRDTCFVNTDLSEWQFETVVTNSAKCAHYTPSRTGAEAVFVNLSQCIEYALGEGER
jgi:hypothetical protein